VFLLGDVGLFYLVEEPMKLVRFLLSKADVKEGAIMPGWIRPFWLVANRKYGL